MIDKGSNRLYPIVIKTDKEAVRRALQSTQKILLKRISIFSNGRMDVKAYIDTN